MARYPAGESVSDDRPIAVRRKRRISSGQADSPSQTTVSQSTNLDESQQTTLGETKTPTKPKKRVRFSDPRPEASISSSSSTGLTPHIKRTTLATASRSSAPSWPRLLAEKPRRRVSLPTTLAGSLPSPSLTPSPTIRVSGEFQIPSLRQTLDERTKRRLRRNHMSEEINDIDEEKRSTSKMVQQIHELKTELELARQLGKEVAESSNDGGGDTVRIQELENEIGRLKEEMREGSMTADPFVTEDIFHDPTPPHSSSQNDNVDDENLVVSGEGTGNVLREITRFPLAPPVIGAVVQASIPPFTDSDVFRSARLSLEYLFPGETALGLATEDPKLIIDNMLDRLRTLKAQALLAEEALSTSKTQESNLRTQFNAVLQQLDRSRKNAEAISIVHSTERSRADHAESTAHSLETVVEQTTLRVKELESDVDEKQRSIQKLQDALESYRVEVGKLELLITQMEAGHSTALAELRGEMDEAVADLECHVAAEINGRRAAEKEAVERGERIKQLEALERELKDAVNEKQKIIRALETEVGDAKEAGEKEIGSLNVVVGELASGLEGAKADMAKIDREKSRLIKMLEQEKAAGVKAVEAIQAEMAQCMEKIEGVKETHLKDSQQRGVEVAEHKGLLTPVSACRFKDGFREVEGYVEVKRGKVRGRKRPDSGIGILEEDEEDEEMLDA